MSRAGRLRTTAAPNLLAGLAGALPALTFPQPSLWWLAYCSLVPLLLVVRSAETGRQAIVRGWWGGAGFVLAVHHWLLPNVHVFLPLVAVVLGALWAPWGWVVWRLLRPALNARRAAAAVVVIPSAWLLLEAVRSVEYLGGPWGLMGASQWQVSSVLELASLGGVWLVSAVVVAANVAIAALLAAVFGAVRSRGAMVSALVALALLTGLVAGWSAAAPEPEQIGNARVAIVQPGVAPNAEARFDRGARLTRLLVGTDVDLVVWGESSVGSDLANRPDLRRRLVTVAGEIAAPVLVNVDARAADRPGIFKSAVLVTPSGSTVQRYDKVRLVPFGEYIPFRGVLGWLSGPTEAAAENRRRGTGPVLIEVRRAASPSRPRVAGNRLQIGPLVCFESAFPDMSRHLVDTGADIVVVQSATSTFQQSWAPEQHASLGAVRAVETWRPVVHATLTGQSAVFDPDGRRVGRLLTTSDEAAAVYRVPIVTGRSPYVRFGDWVLVLALAVSTATLVRLLRSHRADTSSIGR